MKEENFGPILLLFPLKRKNDIEKIAQPETAIPFIFQNKSLLMKCCKIFLRWRLYK
jgi:hypothetical protein